MEHKEIKTEEEYKKALVRLEQIFDSDLDGDELELLSLLIYNYENNEDQMEIEKQINEIIERDYYDRQPNEGDIK